MITATGLAAELGLPAPTDEQAAVIEAPLEPGLVVAGAGSGKTETMAARVVYLVATGQVRPGTGARSDLHPQGRRGAGAADPPAAGDASGAWVRAWSGATLGAEPGADPVRGDPDVGTYHAFGGRLIADFGPLAGIEPAARVLTPTGCLAAGPAGGRPLGRGPADRPRVRIR